MSRTGNSSMVSINKTSLASSLNCIDFLLVLVVDDDDNDDDNEDEVLLAAVMVTYETLGGMRVVKGFHAEDREHSVFADGVDRLFRNVKKTLTTTNDCRRIDG